MLAILTFTSQSFIFCEGEGEGEGVSLNRRAYLSMWVMVPISMLKVRLKIEITKNWIRLKPTMLDAVLSYIRNNDFNNCTSTA